MVVVDPERFELSTFSMPLRRAPNCAMGPNLIDDCGLLIADYRCFRPITNLQSAIYNPNNPGGPGEIRTLDLLSAIEARSQLRYRPVYGRGVFYLRQGGMSRRLPMLDTAFTKPESCGEPPV